MTITAPNEATSPKRLLKGIRKDQAILTCGHSTADLKDMHIINVNRPKQYNNKWEYLETCSTFIERSKGAK